MEESDLFMEYLKEKPQYYMIVKTPLYIEIIESIEKQAASKTEMKTRFPKIELEDLSLILKSLESLNLVKEIELRDKKIYHLTEEAREFLKAYRKGFKKYGVI